MPSIADWFIHADFESWLSEFRRWSSIVAGAVFGAAWWVWADSYVYEKGIEHSSPPFKYNWPGIIATIALLFINAVSRSDLREISESSGEEGAEIRARLWLLFSFLLAVGAIGGSVSVLITCSQANEFVSMGIGSVLQSGLILAAAMLLWGFRSTDEGYSGYGYI